MERIKNTFTNDIKIVGRSVPVFLILLIAMSGLGAAALLTSYGTATGNTQVSQSLTLNGESADQATTYDLAAAGGDTVYALRDASNINPSWNKHFFEISNAANTDIQTTVDTQYDNHSGNAVQYDDETVGMVTTHLLYEPVTDTSDGVVVDDDGGADYTAVQDAVDAIENGSESVTTVYVRPGTYDPVEVSSASELDLVSTRGPVDTVIDASGSSSGVTVQVAAGSVDVRGFTVKNADSSGIGYWNDVNSGLNHEDVAITHNIITDNGDDGAIIGDTGTLEISGNYFARNGDSAANPNNGNGILAMSIQDADIHDNTFVENADSGIYFDDLTGSGYVANTGITLEQNNFVDNSEAGINNQAGDSATTVTANYFSLNGVKTTGGESSSNDLDGPVDPEVTVPADGTLRMWEITDFHTAIQAGNYALQTKLLP